MKLIGDIHTEALEKRRVERKHKRQHKEMHGKHLHLIYI